MALTTGERFPRREAGLPVDGVVSSGCTDGRGRLHAFRPREALPDALLLRTRAGGEPVLACWARTQVFEVRIEPALVEVYLKEVQAPASAVQAWRAQLGQGTPWQEAYVKTARIELVRPGAGAIAMAAARAPTGRGLELLPLGGEPARAGATLAIRVLLDGRPVEGQAVELVSERSPFGIWRRSDAKGLVMYPLPFGGRWLLRATHLQPPDGAQRRWRSHFATLALDAP